MVKFNNMKTLKFKDNLVKMILSGEKSITWRLFDDKDLTVGDDLVFINKDTGEEFGIAKILDIKEKQIKDINNDDYVGHEKFEGYEKMFENYKKYYGEKVVPETIVKMIRFDFKQK